MGNFHTLTVWDDSCYFAKEIYEISNKWNDYGLKNQITRSAVSIASNFAEGSERNSDTEFIRFLNIANASCCECRTQMRIANMIGYLTSDNYENLEAKAESICKRLESLIKFLSS